MKFGECGTLRSICHFVLTVPHSLTLGLYAMFLHTYFVNLTFNAEVLMCVLNSNSHFKFFLLLVFKCIEFLQTREAI